MPSFAISQFIILLEPLWVPADFLLLSTGPLLYIIRPPGQRVAGRRAADQLSAGAKKGAERKIFVQHLRNMGYFPFLCVASNHQTN